MKPRCRRHSLELVKSVPHGEDRVRKHYACRNCPYKTVRNVKKPRFASRPLKDLTAPKTPQKPQERKRKPIRKVSKKRQKELAEYSRLRKQYMEDNPVCQVCGREPSDQIHHTFYREGKRLNDKKYWKAVGPICHDRIHQNPAWAKANGLLMAVDPLPQNK